MLNLAKSDKFQGPFTPHSVSRLKSEPKSEEPKQRPRANVSVQVNAGDILGGLLKVAAYFGKKKEQRSQELDGAVHKLAARYGGFVGLPDLVGCELCSAGEGRASLQRLQRRGDCIELCEYKGESVYLFPAYLVRFWECPHCQAQEPATKDHHRHCSGCGAKMELKIH